MPIGCGNLRPITRLHLPEQLVATCIAEASRYYPLESGGTFMGYVNDGWAVVEALIPAGPKAHRSRHGFAPDQGWQLAQIAECYERSDRRTTYLGDWHSHPGATSGILSRRDHRALRRIVDAPDARCPQPIMTVLWGSPSGWALATWRGSLAPRRLWRNALQVDPVESGR